MLKYKYINNLYLYNTYIKIVIWLIEINFNKFFKKIFKKKTKYI